MLYIYFYLGPITDDTLYRIDTVHNKGLQPRNNVSYLEVIKGSSL